jgi:hypothetical protein
MDYKRFHPTLTMTFFDISRNVSRPAITQPRKIVRFFLDPPEGEIEKVDIYWLVPKIFFAKNPFYSQSPIAK